jgi:hypothetical protein
MIKSALQLGRVKELVVQVNLTNSQCSQPKYQMYEDQGGCVPGHKASHWLLCFCVVSSEQRQELSKPSATGAILAQRPVTPQKKPSKHEARTTQKQHFDSTYHMLSGCSHPTE